MAKPGRIFFSACSGCAWFVVLMVLPAGGPMRAAEFTKQAIGVIPQDTAVLLLPVLDATSDSKNMEAPRRSVIRHREQVEFITRQFRMLGDSLAIKAAAVSPEIDLASVGARTEKNLDLLAHRANADWVVSLVVQDVDCNQTEGNEFKISTRLVLQVWNARLHEWIVNAPFTGDADGQGSPVMIFLRSLESAAKVSLADLLKAYPQVVPVGLEESHVDYLAGQTQVWVGNVKETFSGLNHHE